MRLLLAALLCLAAGPALAHPHVWIVAKAELVFAPDGKLASVRHRWTFDEAYSSFAVQGLDKNGDGRTTPDELAELAKTSTGSLDEFGYFTHLKANGTKQVFGAPRDERMSLDDGRLTLVFDLPLAAPVPGRTVVLDVFDPTFFVDFQTSPDPDAVTLSGAPAGCSLRVTRPKPAATADAGQSLSESFFQGLSAGSAYGAQFAGRAMAVCP